MKDENKKVVVNLPEGTAYAEVTVREGEACKLLDPKPPVKVNITGTIGTPAEFLKKRIDTDQINQKRCHALVDRVQIEITLVINENDEYLRGQIVGKLEIHPKFSESGINTGKVWTPSELGMFFKMNRSMFGDKQVNMKLVTELMNFTATVNNKIERSVKETGDRTDNFAQAVNSNLPGSFTLTIPIFKGMKPETLEVETFAKINGREVSFVLISPGANQTVEEIRDKIIDEQLEQIREIAPGIAIIEV